MEYIAHINEKTGEHQSVKEHSENTANLCRDFAVDELRDLFYVTGLLHDIGKYQPSFQRHIMAEANLRVEHAGCGANAAYNAYHNLIGLLMAYCIAGHHGGIPDGGQKDNTADMVTLMGRLKRSFEDYSLYNRELVIPKLDMHRIAQYFTEDCDNKDLAIDKYAFLTRYCFSCLTDADSLDTAAFCGNAVDGALITDFQQCLQLIEERLSRFVCETALQKTRAKLQRQVFDKEAMDAEIYLMNMPTGSGKTLCSMKFALMRAVAMGKKRIIYVIPYNSIIDQTVDVFESIFGESAQILRHQSSFSYEDESEEEKEIYTVDYQRKALAGCENWDAPTIIVTTAVQFFESLHGNKRKKLRKMHNMADSILIFDEAHMMPLKYLQTCLQSISFLTKYLHSEAVFLTATMPDFRSLVYEYALPTSKIVDLIEDTSDFDAFQKCKYHDLGEKSLDALLMESSDAPSRLFIVNRKKTARELYQRCAVGKCYHLSTYMTGVDRRKKIADIKRKLEFLKHAFPDGRDVPEEMRITIISTSLIEAGVDLDVHTVFRELAGLDSVLQAGGRCNREGKRKNADVYVFTLEEDGVGDAPLNIERYETRRLLKEYGDISSPEVIKEYYAKVFATRKDELTKGTMSKRCQHFESIPFRTYAEEFSMIDTQNTVSLVAPTKTDSNSIQLVEKLRFSGATKELLRKLQKFTCSISKKEMEDLARQNAIAYYEPGIWCLKDGAYYDEDLGVIFEARDFII